MRNGDRRPRQARKRPPPQTTRPPVDLARGAPADARRLEDEGIEWLIWVAGRGLGGTGERGLARVEAIHFAHADRPDRPLLEALIGHGRFEGLYPEELRRLRARARPIETQADDAGPPR